jgi:hypothetical protein
MFNHSGIFLPLALQESAMSASKKKEKTEKTGER